MNLLVLCPHYEPDVAPTGEIMTRIADELIGRGHRLHIVTSLPWYRDHEIEEGWRGRLVRHEDHEWGRITRVHPFPTDKSNIPARALAFIGFSALATILALLDRSRPDAVMAMSPPLFLGAGAKLAAIRHRVPFVFNIQDVFPDAAVEVGALSGEKVIKAASLLERESYLAADAVTVLSDDLQDNVVGKIRGRRGRRGDPSKVRVIPNFVDTARIRPADAENEYRRQHDLVGKTVVMYAGNVGFSQSLDLVVDAAERLAHRRDVVFVINGGGSARAELEERAADMANVRFVDMQPKERLPELMAAGDIHVVPLRRGLARSSVPSKLYTILAAGRPVVAAVDPGTEVPRTLADSGAGTSVPPDDSVAFTDALTKMLDSPEDRARMGRDGRAFVEGWASPAAVGAAYEQLFEELVRSRGSHRTGFEESEAQSSGE